MTKSYNCPDCPLVLFEGNPCDFCGRNNSRTATDSNNITYKFTTEYMNDPCSRCPNHPKNGGSGVCHCTIPYHFGTGITYKSGL